MTTPTLPSHVEAAVTAELAKRDYASHRPEEGFDDCEMEVEQFTVFDGEGRKLGVVGVLAWTRKQARDVVWEALRAPGMPRGLWFQ